MSYDGLHYEEAIIGSRLVKHASNQGFINIPICASTLLKFVALRNGYTYLETPYTYDETMVFATIIREPWERYLSGLSEYASRGYDMTQDIDRTYEQLFETGEWVRHLFNELLLGDTEYQIIFDGHTIPQHMYIEPFLNNQVDLMRMDRNDFTVLTKQLAKYFNMAKIPESAHVNPQYKRDVGLGLGERLLEREDGWMEQWKRTYAEDIKLWERANEDSSG